MDRFIFHKLSKPRSWAELRFTKLVEGYIHQVNKANTQPLPPEEIKELNDMILILTSEGSRPPHLLIRRSFIASDTQPLRDVLVIERASDPKSDPLMIIEFIDFNNTTGKTT